MLMPSFDERGDPPSPRSAGPIRSSARTSSPGSALVAVERQRLRVVLACRGSPPTSASTTATPSASRSTPPRRRSTWTSIAWVLRRQGRSPGRAAHRHPRPEPARTVCPTPAPVSSIAATGPSRRRGTCRPPRSPASTSRSSIRPRQRRQPATSSSSCAMTTRTSDLLFQTSDTTWQAYNHLRRQQPLRRLARRPRLQGQLQPSLQHARATRREDWVFNAEYPMVRCLEANGYDVTYSTGVDTDRRGPNDLLRIRSSSRSATTSTWSGPQRANVENARASGVHLAFFSGNEVFWKTRWEPSIDGTGTRVSHARHLQGNARERQDRSDVRRLDRHLARQALQPAGRRRPPRERADRHDLHGQLLQGSHDQGHRHVSHRSRSGATRASRRSHRPAAPRSPPAC